MADEDIEMEELEVESGDEDDDVINCLLLYITVEEIN